jgi:hypothetical protein
LIPFRPAMPSTQCFIYFTITIALSIALDSAAPGQVVPSSDDPKVASSSSLPDAIASLPDSPGSIASNRFERGVPDGVPDGFQNVPPNNGVMAGHLDKYVKPGQEVPRLRPGDKILLGFKDSIGPLSASGWVLSAGWEQLVNGSPNYGTDGKAFAQRLGAAAARNISEAIFSDSVMSTVLHEDPRFYKMGAGHNVFKRAIYAATRPIITRTDAGNTTLNLAYLSGNLAGAALTQAYYPPVNRGLLQVLQTYGGSIGGGALGFLSSEFLDDILRGIHLEK